jgi:hypothetical protein
LPPGTAIAPPKTYEKEVADPSEWMEAAFGHLRRRIESGDYPHLLRAIEANRTAGGKDEDLGRMASSEGRFERGLELLLDGIEAALARRREPVKRRRGR